MAWSADYVHGLACVLVCMHVRMHVCVEPVISPFLHGGRNSQQLQKTD